MKKIAVGVVVCLVLLCTSVKSEESDFGISFGLGYDTVDVDVYRIGIEKNFSSKWFVDDTGFLSGYFDLSYNLWKSRWDSTSGISLSPVFAYYFNMTNPSIKPYIEGGIGLILVDDYTIGGRDLSTNLLFEDRIGVGLRIRQFDLNLGYIHYSNADFKMPNDGLDIWIASLSWSF